MTHIALSGSTGSIGYELLNQLMYDKRFDAINVLVRDIPKAQQLHAPLGISPKVIYHQWGVGHPISKQMADVDVLIHLAANTCLKPMNPQAYEVNTKGLESLLAGLDANGFRGHFIYVSTAYGIGKTPPVVVNEQRWPQRQRNEFRNDYEHSKHLAEYQVNQWIDKGNSACVVRPSIVAGRSTDGYSVRRGMIYDPITAMDLLIPKGRHTVDFPFRGDAQLNVVHVDHLAAALRTIIAKGTKTQGHYFHLTANQCITPAQIAHQIKQKYRNQGIDIHIGFSDSPINGHPEPLLQRGLRSLEPYLNEPYQIFTTTQTNSVICWQPYCQLERLVL